MEAFKATDYEYPPKRPSLDSVLRQKKRQQELARQQAAYKATAQAANQDESLGTVANALAYMPDEEIQLPETPMTEMEQKMLDEAREISLVGHLTELRHRIIIMVAAILVGACVCYYFVDEIMALIVAPAGKLYYMRPTEAFFTYMKVALVAGTIVASPVVFYQVWSFVAPALSQRERKLTNWILPTAIGLFGAGIVFSYAFVLPAAVKFFIGFSTEELQPLFSFGQYVDFVISFILPFGIIFETPLIITILGYFNLITSKFLKAKRKIFILLSFIIGAVVSPTPDVFSQSMIALPMIVLYESGVFIVGKIMKK